MPDSEVARLHAWLAEHEGELLERTRELIRIPSVESEPEEGAPFGRENRRALDFTLELAREAGMRTRNLEGFVGYAEFGEGPGLVVSVGHLDVVPAGEGWKHDPFGAEIEDGFLYGRGAVDDKGPTMASFYAARALQACFPDLGVRIRSVFGCNEESGFRCIHRYAESEEPPTFGVAPDSGWPLYHAEKGIANLIVEAPRPEGALTLLSMSAGQRPNIVIDRAELRLAVSPAARPAVEAALTDAWDRNVTWRWEGDELVLEAIGKAAHGSAPFAGDNAAVRLFRFVEGLAPAEEAVAWQRLRDLGHPGGAGVGIAGSDEPSGELTANLGIVETRDGRLRCTLNVRYPVTWRFEDVRRRAEERLSEWGYFLVETTDSRPLYFPVDHPLVTTIVEVYAEETGERLRPGVMGGGTYARALPNTVSIGTGWTGDGYAHERDERLKVEHLFRMSRIYAHILYRLALLALSSR